MFISIFSLIFLIIFIQYYFKIKKNKLEWSQNKWSLYDWIPIERFKLITFNWKNPKFIFEIIPKDFKNIQCLEKNKDLTKDGNVLKITKNIRKDTSILSLRVSSVSKTQNASLAVTQIDTNETCVTNDLKFASKDASSSLPTSSITLSVNKLQNSYQEKMYTCIALFLYCSFVPTFFIFLLLLLKYSIFEFSLIDIFPIQVNPIRSSIIKIYYIAMAFITFTVWHELGHGIIAKFLNIQIFNFEFSIFHSFTQISQTNRGNLHHHLKIFLISLGGIIFNFLFLLLIIIFLLLSSSLWNERNALRIVKDNKLIQDFKNRNHIQNLIINQVNGHPVDSIKEWKNIKNENYCIPLYDFKIGTFLMNKIEKNTFITFSEYILVNKVDTFDYGLNKYKSVLSYKKLLSAPRCTYDSCPNFETCVEISHSHITFVTNETNEMNDTYKTIQTQAQISSNPDSNNVEQNIDQKCGSSIDLISNNMNINQESKKNYDTTISIFANQKILDVLNISNRFPKYNWLEKYFPPILDELKIIAALNLLIAILNLIPSYNSDGHRALENLKIILLCDKIHSKNN